MRVAKMKGNRYKVEASEKAKNTPLARILGYNKKEFLPTVSFAVDFDIPEESFNRASKVISEVVIRAEDVGFATEIV